MPPVFERPLTLPFFLSDSVFIPRYPWLDPELLLGRPNIGSLMGLCEENYDRLVWLAADLRSAQGAFIARCAGNLDLHLEVLDQARYTTTLRLTYYVAAGDLATYVPEPDARVRIYHDARQAEVLGFRVWGSRVLFDAAGTPDLLEKWRINLVLGKWLAYCRQQGYRFRLASGASPTLRTGRVAMCEGERRSARAATPAPDRHVRAP